MEIALQGALIGCPAQLSAQDPLNGRGSALRVFSAQRHRQLQHLRWGARGALARIGHQRIKPVSPPVADPAVEGLPGNAHPPPERVGVLTRGQLAHHFSPRLGGRRRIGGLANQLIPK